jgi:FKBP-type peptidyl-prolyl cis-trans isomerase 2
VFADIFSYLCNSYQHLFPSNFHLIMRTAKNGDVVKVHYTGKLTNGEVFDSSKGREPLEFKLGEGEMIPGFEAAILGMQVGEKKVINIPKEEAYGDPLPQLIADFPKSELPEGFPMEEGAQISVTLADGRQIPAVITAVKENSITIDANHPLAGKDLIFEVELVEIGSSLIL